MTKQEIFKAAHKLARTFEGNYSACFKLALISIYKLKTSDMKEVKKTLEYECNIRKGGASQKQFNFLSSFENVEMYITYNRFYNYVTTEKASELIKEAITGRKIEIFA